MTITDERAMARLQEQVRLDARWQEFPEWWRQNIHSAFRYAMSDLSQAKREGRYSPVWLRHARDTISCLLQMLEADVRELGEEGPVP